MMLFDEGSSCTFCSNLHDTSTQLHDQPPTIFLLLCSLATILCLGLIFLSKLR